MNETLDFIFSLLAFWLVVYMLGKKLNLSKYGLEIKPFLIKWELKKFKDILYKCSSKGGKVWRIFSWISVAIGAGFMVLTLILLSWNIVRATILNETFSSVALIIPGVTLKLYWLPYFLISVVVTVIIHEAAHGIIALSEGISVKSAGALLLAVFFGGFVELDEKELNAAPRRSKIKVFSAGSSSNVIAGLIVLFLLSGLFVQSPSGLVVLETLEGGPLQRAGIRTWDVIYALNNYEIHTLQDLRDFMSSVKPGEKIVVRTGRGDFIITAALGPEGEQRSIIGLVSSIPYYPSKLGFGYPLDIHLYLTLNWLFLVLISVAAFNMLPVPYLDGDRLLQCLVSGGSKVGDVLKKLLNVLSVFLLLANIVISSL